MNQLILPFLNFFILVGIMVYYLRQPLIDFVSNRHKTLLEDLKVTQAQLHQAQIQYEDFSAKLRALDAEVSAFRGQMKQEGERTREDIMSEGKRVADYVVHEAKLAADNLYSELRQQLLAELGNKIISRAEDALRKSLKPEDRAKLHQEFIRGIGELQ